MAASTAFLARRFPKRHAHVVEECHALEVPAFGVAVPPLKQRMRVVTGAQLEAEERSRRAEEERLRVLAEENARFLAAHRGSKSVQARAARLLARMARTAGPEPTRASPT